MDSRDARDRQRPAWHRRLRAGYRHANVAVVAGPSAPRRRCRWTEALPGRAPGRHVPAGRCAVLAAGVARPDPRFDRARKEGSGEPHARRRAAGAHRLPHRPLPCAGGPGRRRSGPHLCRTGARLQPPSRVGHRRLRVLLPGRGPGGDGEPDPRHRFAGARLHRCSRDWREARNQGRPVRAVRRAGPVLASARSHGWLPDGLAARQGSRRRSAHQGDDSQGAGLPRMSDAPIERQTMETDIVCTGFGPATAGFLATIAPHILNPDGTPAIESPSMPGMPLQVMCYERADGIGFTVSGVVTRARGIRAALPDAKLAEIPMATPVTTEKVVYLLDPVGASRRSAAMRAADAMVRTVRMDSDHAIELPYTPPFLEKHGGWVFSLGQFLQHVGNELMATGTVQVWPGMPVAEALLDDKGERVCGVRLVDQGVDREGRPHAGFMPGMDIRAALTVVGDGPVGAVGRQLDKHFGLPPGHHQREWALGMKMVVDLPPECDLAAGAVIHTFGYPEPEIFGFFYVMPDHVATVGIFVPSWFQSPMRTAYRYLQHYMLHPYLWRYLKGGRLRSWGAKSLQESGKRGEPFLVGEGYARIGEGSGSTNVLTGSGVDEA